MGSLQQPATHVRKRLCPTRHLAPFFKEPAHTEGPLEPGTPTNGVPQTAGTLSPPDNTLCPAAPGDGMTGCMDMPLCLGTQAVWGRGVEQTLGQAAQVQTPSLPLLLWP